ncbi:hypothetical protein B0H13DRAFT_1887988 [Mycena leptocephala]|nr:hypothetical protein B0H13DRAFT_1887988 [Mycena leptocephala]
MSPVYLFRVKRTFGVQWNRGHFHGEKPNLYVKIYQDSQLIHRTQTVDRTIEPQWDGDVFTVSSDNPTAVISLKLFHDATLSMFGDPCLGALYIQLNVLLNLCTADGSSKGYLSPRLLNALFTFSLDASLQLVGVEGMSKGKSAGTLLVHIESITQAQAKTWLAAWDRRILQRGSAIFLLD